MKVAVVTDDTDADVEEPLAPGRNWPGWGRLLVLVAALCFLAGAVGWWVGQTGDPSFSEVDEGFLHDMSIHHDGAINLSFAYLGDDNDPTFRHLAREIATGQSQEIAVMNGLVGEAGAARERDDGTAMGWMGAPVPVDEMPGMATPEELDRVSEARGGEADDLFTRLMIEHHAAGVEMADYEARNGQNADVTRLAAAMSRVQRTEVQELNSRREDLGLPPVEVSFDTIAGHGH